MIWVAASVYIGSRVELLVCPFIPKPTSYGTAGWAKAAVGRTFKDLQVPPEIVSQIVTVLREDQEQSAAS
jgi:hypothetical protein